MAYTTKTRIENYLGITIDSSLVTSLNQWITAVGLWIDGYVGKTFEASGATDKYYDGNDDDELIVDSFYGTPTVSILNPDGSTVMLTLNSGHFATYPYNTTEKNEIRLLPGNPIGDFPCGEKRVKINATWAVGSSVPADIELVATKLVGDVLDRGLRGGRVTSISLGDIQTSLADIDQQKDPLGVFSILDGYRDVTL